MTADDARDAEPAQQRERPKVVCSAAVQDPILREAGVNTCGYCIGVPCRWPLREEQR